MLNRQAQRRFVAMINPKYIRAERVALHAEIKKIDKQLAYIKESAYGGDVSSQLEWSRLWHRRESNYARLRILDGLHIKKETE